MDEIRGPYGGRLVYSVGDIAGDIDVYSTSDMGPAYIIAPVGNPGAVEAALPNGWCVGDGWWASSPSQKQLDGRWLLYLTSIRGPQVWEVKVTNV